MNAPHIVSEPAILYFGTPVVLISSVNQDGSANLAPMSSAFWLGWRCVLGLSAVSKTTENLIRTGQCALNLPSVDNVAAVNRLARLTGSDPVPPGKLARGYAHEKAKFETAGLTAVPSLTVAAPRVLECPVQMEGVLYDCHPFGKNVSAYAFEVHITRLHVHEALLEGDGSKPHIDPERWQPLIMSFCRFFGLGGEVHPSRLAQSDFMKFVRQGTGPQPAMKPVS